MDWLLLFHLLGALLFFAGAAVAAVGQLEALRRRRPSEVALLLGTTRWGVLLVGVGALGGRPARKARELAERLAAGGDEPSPELDRAVRDPLSLVLSFASGALLLALVVDMVWKPGA